MPRRDPSKEALWRKKLSEFQTSGLTVGEFCKQEGLSQKSYWYWKARVQKIPSGRGRRAKLPDENISVSFVSVELNESKKTIQVLAHE